MTENLDVRDNISISLRRDKNTAAIRKLVDEAPGRDFTEKVMTAVRSYLAEDNERTDREYREDQNKSNKGDSKMQKSELIEFVRDQWGEPDFQHVEGPLEDVSEGFLKGYVSTRLGVDMEAIEDGGLQYLRGLLEGGEKVDGVNLRNDRARDTSRVDELKKQRLEIGEKSDLSESLQKRVDKGELSEVEALRIQRKNVGEEVEDKDVDEIRADRIEKFQQGDE